MQVSQNRTKIQSLNKQLAQRKCCSMMMMMWVSFLRKAYHDVIAVRLFTSVLLGLHSKTLLISTYFLRVVKTFLPHACNRTSFGSLTRRVIASRCTSNLLPRMDRLQITPHTSKTELVEVHSVGHVYLELVKRPIGFSITHNDGQNALSEQGTAFCLCYVVHF